MGLDPLGAVEWATPAQANTSSAASADTKTPHSYRGREPTVPKFKVKDRVCFSDLHEGKPVCGWIAKIRLDDLGRPIYTVLLDQENITPTGYMLARDEEIKHEQVCL